jgi:hypothetical protein
MLALAMAAIVAGPGCDGDEAGGGGGGSAAGVYSLTVGVTSESGTLSTIAIDLEPASADGTFVTDGGRPDCDILAPGAFGVLSILGENRIRIGVASFLGFDTPVDLARCRFDAAESIAPADFSTELVDAVAPDGNPPSPPPVVALTSVTAEESAPGTTTVDEPATTTTLAEE